MIRLRNPGYLLREFCVIVPSHWPAYVGRNQFMNTNFTQLITRISKPSDVSAGLVHYLLHSRTKIALDLTATRVGHLFVGFLGRARAKCARQREREI